MQLCVLRLRHRGRRQPRLHLCQRGLVSLLLLLEFVVLGLERVDLVPQLAEHPVRAGIVPAIAGRRDLVLERGDRAPVRLLRMEWGARRRLNDLVDAADVGEKLRALRVVRHLVEPVDGRVHGLHLLEAGDEVPPVGLGARLGERGVRLAGLGRHRLRGSIGRLQRIQARRLLGQLLFVLRLGLLLPQILLVDRRQLGQQLVERIGGLGVLALVDLRANAVHQATQGRRLRVLPGHEFLDLAHRVVVLALPRIPVGFCLLGLLAEGGGLAAQRTGVAEHLVDITLRFGRVVAVDLGKRGLERRVHRIAPRSQGIVARGLCIDRGVL